MHLSLRVKPVALHRARLQDLLAGRASAASGGLSTVTAGCLPALPTGFIAGEEVYTRRTKADGTRSSSSRVIYKVLHECLPQRASGRQGICSISNMQDLKGFFTKYGAAR